MKKIYTLFIILLTLAISAQADGTKGIKLSFTGATNATSTSGITVNVTDLNGNSIQGVSASLTATSINIFQTQNACANDTILCPSNESGSGYGNNQNDTITFTFKITGLNTYISNFNQINLGIVALNASGQYQARNTHRTFTLSVNTGAASDSWDKFASENDIDINPQGTSTTVSNYISHKLAGTATSTAETLYLNIVLKRTDIDGCYAGLTNVEITIPTYTATWNIKESENSDVIKSFTSEETEYGKSATCTIPAYPFTTLNYNETGYTESFTVTKENVTESSSEDIIADFSSLPFTRSTTSDYHWYYLRDGENKDDSLAYWSRVHSLEDNSEKSPCFQMSAIGVLRSNYMWAFVGDPINGFQIVNCYYGIDKNLAPSAELSTFSDAKGATPISLIPSETTQIWQIANGTSDNSGSAGGFGFYINYENVPYYMNSNGAQKILAIWNAFGKYSHWYVDSEVTSAYLDELNKYYTDVYSVYEGGTFGKGLGNYGYYVWSENNIQQFSKDSVAKAISAADTYKNSTTASDQKAIDDAALGLYNYYYYFTTYGPNFPTSGTFFTISNGTYYVLASKTAGDQTTALTSSASTSASSDANAIWYYDGKGLCSYTSGYYLTLNSALCNTSSTENEFYYSGNTGYTGYYNVKIGNTYYLSINPDNGTVSANESANTTNDAIALKEVTTLPITLNQANYIDVTEKNESTTAKTYNYFATICLPVNYKISKGTRTFVVTGAETENNESYIVLKEVTGIIPANTAVILLGTSNSATATVNEGTETADSIIYTNYLTGVGEATQLSASNYYFGKNKNSEYGDAGFYKPGTNATSKYITNKGYITAAKAAALGATTSSKGFTFAFGNDDDPTGINNATDKNADSFDANAPRYDLKGMRVGKDYKGIVIINGKKYLIM